MNDTYLPLATVFGYASINGSARTLGDLLLRLCSQHHFVVVHHRHQRGLHVIQCVDDLLLVVHVVNWLQVSEGKVNFCDGLGLVFLGWL